jgi:antitoxin (DNA-binding transcriptional repressor) of toxin-antitoxin stability system
MRGETDLPNVNVAQLKNQLSKYIRLARSGKEVVIRDRNLPVAKLAPFVPDGASEEQLLLVAAGKMRLPTRPLCVKELLRIPTGQVKGSRGIQAVVDEREQACEKNGGILGYQRRRIKAAGSLQTAAALNWWGQRPSNRSFVSGDHRLCEAARKVRFFVVELQRSVAGQLSRGRKAPDHWLS